MNEFLSKFQELMDKQGIELVEPKQPMDIKRKRLI